MRRPIEATMEDFVPLNQQQEEIRKELKVFISSTKHCGDINSHLVKALKKYGQHGITCTWSRLGRDPCTCGFKAALKAAGGKA